MAAAEDALGEAFATALVDWPLKGCPQNPEAWLLIVARRKMIDGVRRRRSAEAGAAQLRILADGLDAAESESAVPDQRLVRALAVAEIQGAEVALQTIRQLAADVRLAEYQPYWATSAQLLANTGAHPEARRAYEIAIGLERDPAVRRFLQRRHAALPHED